MRFLVHPLHLQYHASTKALILAAAPERSECVHDWPQNLGEPEGAGYIRRDYVAVDASDPHSVIGYGAMWPQGEGRFRMDLIVAPDRRRQGVGSALLQTLFAELQAQGATVVQARAFDDRSESLAFLLHRGFTETNRMILQRLYVANVYTAPLPTLTAHLNAQHITIVTLDREQTHTADWLIKMLGLLRATGPERVGNPYRVGSDTGLWSAEAAARVWESSHPLSLDAFFIAKMHEQYVGLSFLSQGSPTRQGVIQGDTGVHVDWRRRGIASLLKLHTIAYAQRHGYEEITTRTASQGMCALNERLGFQQDGVEVRLVKRIDVE